MGPLITAGSASDDVETARFQPISIYNFQGSWYLRSRASGPGIGRRMLITFRLALAAGAPGEWEESGQRLCRAAVDGCGGNLPKFTLFAGSALSCKKGRYTAANHVETDIFIL